MLKVSALLAWTLLFTSTSFAAGEAQVWTVIYDDPASPRTSRFRIEQLPSFVFMPGAPVLVSYTPASGAGLMSTVTGDLDCADFAGPVAVGQYDPHGLDADFDGIGCE